MDETRNIQVFGFGVPLTRGFMVIWHQLIPVVVECIISTGPFSLSMMENIYTSKARIIENVLKYFDGILPKGPYPPCLRRADRALSAGYPRFKSVRLVFQATDQIKRLYELFCKVDATQVEINPFGETPDGEGELGSVLTISCDILLWGNINMYWYYKYRQFSNIRRTQSQNKCFSSRLAVVFAQSIEAMC